MRALARRATHRDRPLCATHVGANGFELHKSVDSEKDQTYFLNAVPLGQLSECEPAWRSEEARCSRHRKTAGLHNHQRKDSTGICFIGERRFRDFLARYVSSTPGPIVGVDGCFHGQHIGLHHYTIGQREGLGIGGRARKREAPWYVVSKDANRNALVVSQVQEDLDSHWLTTPSLNWLAEPPVLPLQCTAKVRYRQADQPAVSPTRRRILDRLHPAARGYCRTICLSAIAKRSASAAALTRTASSPAAPEPRRMTAGLRDQCIALAGPSVGRAGASNGPWPRHEFAEIDHAHEHPRPNLRRSMTRLGEPVRTRAQRQMSKPSPDLVPR
jgi:hypothetical protein